jgi:myo-inositol-1(or 4)-monophosphatase
VTDLELAERAARAAGEVLLDRLGAARGVEAKSSATDLVSDADREAEAAIYELLRAHRHGDGILAEEGASAEAVGERRWIVDPLDGTTNYLYGFPAWSVSIALEDGDGGAVAVVHDPRRGETFRAERGGGAELNGEPIAVGGRDRLETALIATGFAYRAELRAAQATALRSVLPRVRDIRRAGSAALDLAWTAAGRLDGYYERGLKPWDWAAGRLLVTEAGGALATLDGEPPGLAAANRALLPPLVELLGSAGGVSGP